MNIFVLLSRNLSRKSRTCRPEDAVPYPTDFRGRLIHNVDLCTGCGTCVYTCSPSAIKISDIQSNAANWRYTEDRCTFCGFCVQYCPTNALSFAQETPKPIAERSEHYIDHPLKLQPCKSCGKPVYVLPENSLEKLYGKPLPAEILETQGLCEDCRQQLTSKRFLNAMVVKGDREND